MASPLEVCRQQRAIRIFVFGNSFDAITVRRRVSIVNVNPEEKEETDRQCDRPQSGRSTDSVNENKAKQVNTLITADRRITSAKLQVSYDSAYSLVRSVGYLKVCSKQISRRMTDFMKKQRITVSQHDNEVKWATQLRNQQRHFSKMD